MTELNEAIKTIPLPIRMRALPISEKGWYIPWFVYIDQDGIPDFRVIGPGKISAAVTRNLCWLCGQPLGKFKVFTVGPMCVINRVSAEPPSHIDCAQYAAVACPFLTKPKMRRDEATDKPERSRELPGMMLDRNPGATALVVALKHKVFRVDHGVMFNFGKPERIIWYAEGRAATRAEVDRSIETGLPYLRDAAARDGQKGLIALERAIADAQYLLPA